MLRILGRQPFAARFVSRVRTATFTPQFRFKIQDAGKSSLVPADLFFDADLHVPGLDFTLVKYEGLTVELAQSNTSHYDEERSVLFLSDLGWFCDTTEYKHSIEQLRKHHSDEKIEIVFRKLAAELAKKAPRRNPPPSDAIVWTEKAERKDEHDAEDGCVIC